MGEQVDAGLWGYSSVGRAPALQAGGQEFKSPYLHESRVRATANGRRRWRGKFTCIRHLMRVFEGI